MQDKRFPRDAAKSTFEEIDHGNVSRFGFSRLRFPQSMVDTYQFLCSTHNRRFDEETARRVRSIGARVFEVSPKVMEGVRETLFELVERGSRLILATKGDHEVQEQRVESS